MSLKERLKRQLTSARALSERLLADFKTPEDWTRQLHPGCNHALWFAGHMANTDNFLISMIAPERARENKEFGLKFGMGSQPSPNPADYPPPEEVLATMRERRQSLLSLLDGLSDDDLSQKTADGAPEFLSDFASVFELAIWHEGLHSGQLSLTRRALGHAPVMGAG
jgi:uncharacterized damage-inducible protein DinB